MAQAALNGSQDFNRIIRQLEQNDTEMIPYDIRCIMTPDRNMDDREKDPAVRKGSRSTPRRQRSRRMLTGTTSRTSTYRAVREHASVTLEGLKLEYEAMMADLDGRLMNIEYKFGRAEEQEAYLMSELHRVRMDLSALKMARENTLEEIRTFSGKHEDRVHDLMHREARFKEDCSTPNVLNIIQEKLNCPCCFNMMKDRIFQCSAGHMVCSNCYKRLAQCPQCRATYSREPIRNRLAEHLAEELK